MVGSILNVHYLCTKWNFLYTFYTVILHLNIHHALHLHTLANLLKKRRYQVFNLKKKKVTGHFARIFFFHLVWLANQKHGANLLVVKYCIVCELKKCFGKKNWKHFFKDQNCTQKNIETKMRWGTFLRRFCWGFSKLDFLKKHTFLIDFGTKNEKIWVNFFFCLARNKCLQNLDLGRRGIFFQVWDRNSVEQLLYKNWFSIFSIFQKGLWVKEISRKKVTRLCKKYAFQVHF